MNGFVASLLVLLEKIAALIGSQRFLTTILGVIVVVVLLQNAVAAMLGLVAWDMPDEATLTAQLAEVLGVLITFVTAIMGVLQLLTKLQESIISDPPHFGPTWKVRFSQFPTNVTLQGGTAQQSEAREGMDRLSGVPL